MYALWSQNIPFIFLITLSIHVIFLILACGYLKKFAAKQQQNFPPFLVKQYICTRS